VKEMGQCSLKQSTDSRYTGANVEGTARVFIPDNGSFPVWGKKCPDVVDKNYEGISN